MAEYTFTITIDVEPELRLAVPADTEHEALRRVRDYFVDALASIEHQLGDTAPPQPYGRDDSRPMRWLGFSATTCEIKRCTGRASWHSSSPPRP